MKFVTYLLGAGPPACGRRGWQLYRAGLMLRSAELLLVLTVPFATNASVGLRAGGLVLVTGGAIKVRGAQMRPTGREGSLKA